MRVCSYFDNVVELLEDKEDGTRVTTEWLAGEVGVSTSEHH